MSYVLAIKRNDTFTTAAASGAGRVSHVLPGSFDLGSLVPPVVGR